METFEQKALDYYGEIVIVKDLIHQAGFRCKIYSNICGRMDSFKLRRKRYPNRKEQTANCRISWKILASQRAKGRNQKQTLQHGNRKFT